MSHTPGPWTASEQRSRDGRSLGWIVGHSNGRIGWSSYATSKPNAGEAGPPFPISEANARLIAAAPDLLAACKAMFHDPDTGDLGLVDIAGTRVCPFCGSYPHQIGPLAGQPTKHSPECERLQAAIAKATIPTPATDPANPTP